MALILMRTCTMMSAILVCLSLAALSCQSCEDSTYGAGVERDKTEQTDAWQHPYMLYASMFRVGSGAGPFRPSTDLRSAAAIPEGKRMSTSSGFLRGIPRLGIPRYSTGPSMTRLSQTTSVRAVTPTTVQFTHHGLSVSILLRRTRPTGDRLR